MPSYIYIYCSSERETNLVSSELSSFKSVEKDWQSQLVINFIDQVCTIIHVNFVRKIFVLEISCNNIFVSIKHCIS